MLWLIDNCKFVMTDSGGLQKEAYFFQKRCLTLRDETEWVELIEARANFLVSANKEKILSAVDSLENIDSEEFPSGLYGDGEASVKIIEILLNVNLSTD